jgi:phosphoenolpyruvate carboxykinase (GTP)
MAMLPFVGYNMADYFANWLTVGKKLSNPPKIFRVNWFRTGDNGKFLWPGFGENLRVIKWVLERVVGKGAATETAIGYVPTMDAIDRNGIDLSDASLAQLLKVDLHEWGEAIGSQEEFFSKFGDRLPHGMKDEHNALRARVTSAPDYNVDH